MTTLLSACMLVTLILADSAAALPSDRAQCQKAMARRIVAVSKAAGACLAACHDAAAGGARRECIASAPDNPLRRCLNRARQKAFGGIARACAGNACPACYAGGECAGFANAQVGAAFFAAGWYFERVFCDDAGSRDGFTDREARCGRALWQEIQRYTQRWMRCQKVPDVAGCIEIAQDEAAAIIGRCRDLPECAWPDNDFIGDVLSGADGVLGQWVPTIFCAGACGNGVVDDGEQCDPHASPAGCEAGFCTPRCACQSLCGDGAVSGAETCDETAPAADDGCPDGLSCTACLFCSPRCGDGQVVADEVCEPPSLGCPAGNECLRCGACGEPVPLLESATEDVSPCSETVGDRWTFEVRAGTIATIEVDTVDALTAANLGMEASCGGRAGGGMACSFAPPNFDPTKACPRARFFAPADASCTLTVGVRHLDPELDPCRDANEARYRVSVSGTSLSLVADDVSPGLVSDR